MEKQSPVQRIWELGKSEHGHLITAVLPAVIGVICGMVGTILRSGADHYPAAGR